MTTTSGILSDGRFLRGEPVTINFTADGRVGIEGTGSRFEVDLREIRVSDRIGSIPRFLYLPGARVIETAGNDVVDAALARQKRGRIAHLIHFLETHSGLAVAATICLVAAGVFSLYFGLPALARSVAFQTPEAVEREVGRIALASLTQRLGPSRLSPAQRFRVQAQLTRLLPDRPADRLPRIHFRSGGSSFPNAFAVPGGNILVTDEFVALTSHEDEIASVLAHEIGHLEERHGLQIALRQSFALLLVTSLTGDLSTLTQMAGVLPFLILQSGYSREFEREADRFARDLLLDRKIPLNRFASILRKLTEARPQKGVDFTYLSTHPGTDERLAMFPSPAVPTPVPTQPSTVPSSLSAKTPPARLNPVPKTTPAIKIPGSKQEPELQRPGNRFPSIRRQVDPVVSPELLRRNLRGRVRLRARINERGVVTAVEVIQADHPDHGPLAEAAVKQWAFHPGEKNNAFVSATAEIDLYFRGRSVSLVNIRY